MRKYLVRLMFSPNIFIVLTVREKSCQKMTVTLLGPGLMKQRISNFKSEARARVHMPRVKSENHTLATATVSVRAQKCSPLESL